MVYSIVLVQNTNRERQKIFEFRFLLIALKKTTLENIPSSWKPLTFELKFSRIKKSDNKKKQSCE